MDSIPCQNIAEFSTPSLSTGKNPHTIPAILLPWSCSSSFQRKTFVDKKKKAVNKYSYRLQSRKRPFHIHKRLVPSFRPISPSCPLSSRSGFSP